MIKAFIWPLDIPTHSRRPGWVSLGGKPGHPSTVRLTALTRRVHSSDGGVQTCRKKVPFPVPMHRGPFTCIYTLPPPLILAFPTTPLHSSPSCLSPGQIMYTIHAWTSRPIRPVNPLDQFQARIPNSIRIFAQTPLATPKPKAKPNQSTEKNKRKKKNYPLFAFPVASRSLCVCVDWSMCDD